MPHIWSMDIFLGLNIDNVINVTQNSILVCQFYNIFASEHFFDGKNNESFGLKLH